MIYLDFNATTPCDERVVEAMLPYFSEVFGNPASRQHGPGRSAFMALETARKTVAESIGARSATEIVFTSGATEANNLALKGYVRHHSETGLHIITQATEHPAVLEPLSRLVSEGAELTTLGVDQQGRVDPEEVRAAIRNSTRLISVMLANNETGVLQSLADIATIAHDHGAVLHCDAAQAIGKIPVDVRRLGVDLMSISGHKLYGPKGIGALFVRRCTPPMRLQPSIEGGGHESGIRSGTSNIAGAVGLAHALEIATAALDDESARLKALRDTFENDLRRNIGNLVVNGGEALRLPGTSNIALPGIDGEALMASLPDLAISTGSACASAHPEPSRVLRAMGLPKKLAASSLRISFGRSSTTHDAEVAAQRIAAEAQRLRRR